MNSGYCNFCDVVIDSLQKGNRLVPLQLTFTPASPQREPFPRIEDYELKVGITIEITSLKHKTVKLFDKLKNMAADEPIEKPRAVTGLVH